MVPSPLCGSLGAAYSYVSLVPILRPLVPPPPNVSSVQSVSAAERIEVCECVWTVRAVWGGRSVTKSRLLKMREEPRQGVLQFMRQGPVKKFFRNAARAI